MPELRTLIERATTTIEAPPDLVERAHRIRDRRRRRRRVTAGVTALGISLAGVALAWAAFDVPTRPSFGTPAPLGPAANGPIAYAFPGPDGGLEIRLVSPDGTSIGTIPTPGTNPWLHAWSPDGTRLAVTDLDHPVASLWVMGPDGSNPVQVASGEDISVPSWTPDGREIVYAARADGTTSIHVVSADGGEDRTIHLEAAPGTFDIFSAQVSPDGRTIVFDRGTDVGFDLFAMDADGSNVRRLTSTGTDYDPHWSPDGTRIAFTRQDGATSDIFVMAADGSEVQRLTSGPGRTTNLYPEWSPDGRSIAYNEGGGNGQGNLVLINADGSDRRVLVEAGRSGGVLGISWRPVFPGSSSTGADATPGPTGASAAGPEVTPTPSERLPILIAVLRELAARDGVPLYVVERLCTDAHRGTTRRCPDILTDAERAAIVAAYPRRDVRFVAAVGDVPGLASAEAQVAWLGPPTVIDGKVVVGGSQLCGGGLCGNGAQWVVEHIDGRWEVTRPFDGMWIA